jgi:TPR repeat protein
MNDADALFQLGVCYEDGIGVPQNHSEAWSLLSLSASQGHKLASEKLSNLTKKTPRRR